MAICTQSDGVHQSMSTEVCLKMPSPSTALLGRVHECGAHTHTHTAERPAYCNICSNAQLKADDGRRSLTRRANAVGYKPGIQGGGGPEGSVDAKTLTLSLKRAWTVPVLPPTPQASPPPARAPGPALQPVQIGCRTGKMHSAP